MASRPPSPPPPLDAPLPPSSAARGQLYQFLRGHALEQRSAAFGGDQVWAPDGAVRGAGAAAMEAQLARRRAELAVDATAYGTIELGPLDARPWRGTASTSASCSAAACAAAARDARWNRARLGARIGGGRPRSGGSGAGRHGRRTRRPERARDGSFQE
ncbi:hypothetical protein CDD83_11105 [Cordyceps sp. RAO-2017]|nr:hypothetical protein CDD83_11105 [Cordyceps sp. RAO-2017]